MAHPTNPRAPQPLPHHHPIFICPLFLHHHHHHHHHLHHNQLGCPNLCPHHAFHCLTHHHHHHHHHHHLLLTPPPPSLSDQHPISQNPTSAYVNSGVSNHTETDVLGEELKESGEQQQQEPVEEEEDLFVMTDEWMEFFAKSEARRKLEKKKGKR
ncbi:hypothetical protein QJS10_CPB04g01276 [Acorus calamus]|uniref:Uncharacterized protein n=1 Tax=Acorus calamus TaxID=4465 RepID=A0AAV9F451_ACOCL|nr:hypothetical protein QJS10_CPB04g01276 [Acorus calamus]